MNIRRGMLRIWLLLTVLWVVGVALANWEQIAPPELLELRRSRDNPFADIPLTPVARADNLKFAVITALLPPAILLVFGAAFGWAASGFRK